MEMGSLSDWFGVACNAVTAGVAVYAASKAKDWLSPKLNDKKFKFADELIEQFCKLEQESYYLQRDAKSTINTDPDDQGDALEFRKRWNAVYSRASEHGKRAKELSTTLERMKLWGLHPRNIADFKNIISSHSSLAIKIEESLSIGADETRFRLQNSFEYDRQLSECYRSVCESHKKIMKHYSELFS